jgi:hypothetical protein
MRYVYGLKQQLGFCGNNVAAESQFEGAPVPAARLKFEKIDGSERADAILATAGSANRGLEFALEAGGVPSFTWGPLR